jgi:hypothetical protein
MGSGKNAFSIVLPKLGEIKPIPEIMDFTMGKEPSDMEPEAYYAGWVVVMG